MKKTLAIVLAIMLLGTALVLTGCHRLTTVEFTVEGIEANYVLPVPGQKMSYSRQEIGDVNAPVIKFIYAFQTDGDYAFTMTDKAQNSYPLVLKVYNGKVEAEAPEGITLNLTVK